MLFSKFAQAKYLKRLNTPGVFLNTTDSALPQTVVAKLVQAHFAKASGKQPKALLIGFDGARADTMHLLCESADESVTGTLYASDYSAVNTLKQNGGLYLSFAGGTPDAPQETSTAQGWAAVLTGRWGGENGVLKHVPLRTDCPTVLRTLAQQGRSAAFLAEWPDHFNITYTAEIQMAKEQQLPLTFTRLANDRDLQAEFIKHIEGDTDCIFGIFEAPDSNGHTTGFCLQNPRYCTSVTRLDHLAYRLIQTVQARPAYEQEDWLILITSDHGGHQRGHGTQSMFDRMTFIAVNQPIPQ